MEQGEVANKCGAIGYCGLKITVHIYKSRFLVRGEVWYDHEPDGTPVDWVLYRQRSQPVPGATAELYYTIVLDLRQTSEALLKAMSKSAVYKIRRAGSRDRVHDECRGRAGLEELNNFEEQYAVFASTKGLDPLDRPLLSQLAVDGFLEISIARDAAGKAVVYHVYYRDRRRSCLMHSVSLYHLLTDSSSRNALGRANRYLFWQDILRHQAQGLETFDFGGWYPGQTDQSLLDINRFKEEFGGKITREYNCQQVRSLKAQIVLRAAAILTRGRRISAQFRLAGKTFWLDNPRLFGTARAPLPLRSGSPV